MKRIFVVFLFSIFLYACGRNLDAASDTPAGVYKLKNSFSTDSSKQEDIVSPARYKVYTPSNYFIVSVRNDSSFWFGFGSYKKINDTIIEHSMFNSDNTDTGKDVKLTVKRTEAGFIQDIPTLNDGDLPYSSHEQYDSISIKGPSSGIDGLWEHLRSMVINGQDTLFTKSTEYLVFQSGHYLKATRTLVDSSANHFKNDFWLGSFTLNNKMLNDVCESSSDAKFIGAKTNSNCLVNEKEGTLVQIITGGEAGTMIYKSYRRVK